MSFILTRYVLITTMAFHASIASDEKIFKHNRTYYPIDFGKKHKLYCFACDECFVPTNLVLCPSKATKCYFEHVLTYEHDEIVNEHVSRRCRTLKTNHDDECDVGLLVGRRLFACVCSFDACNSHTVMMGPTYYQRYYHVPKTLAGVDFPGWEESDANSVHELNRLFSLSTTFLTAITRRIFDAMVQMN